MKNNQNIKNAVYCGIIFLSALIVLSVCLLCGCASGEGASFASRAAVCRNSGDGRGLDDNEPLRAEHAGHSLYAEIKKRKKKQNRKKKKSCLLQRRLFFLGKTPRNADR